MDVHNDLGKTAGARANASQAAGLWRQGFCRHLMHAGGEQTRGSSPMTSKAIPPPAFDVVLSFSFPCPISLYLRLGFPLVTNPILSALPITDSPLHVR